MSNEKDSKKRADLRTLRSAGVSNRDLEIPRSAMVEAERQRQKEIREARERALAEEAKAKAERDEQAAKDRAASSALHAPTANRAEPIVRQRFRIGAGDGEIVGGYTADGSSAIQFRGMGDSIMDSQIVNQTIRTDRINRGGHIDPALFQPDGGNVTPEPRVRIGPLSDETRQALLHTGRARERVGVSESLIDGWVGRITERIHSGRTSASDPNQQRIARAHPDDPGYADHLVGAFSEERSGTWGGVPMQYRVVTGSRATMINVPLPVCSARPMQRSFSVSAMLAADTDPFSVLADRAAMLRRSYFEEPGQIEGIDIHTHQGDAQSQRNPRNLTVDYIVPVPYHHIIIHGHGRPANLVRNAVFQEQHGRMSEVYALFGRIFPNGEIDRVESLAINCKSFWLGWTTARGSNAAGHLLTAYEQEGVIVSLGSYSYNATPIERSHALGAAMSAILSRSM